jgi:hypothetical protein
MYAQVEKSKENKSRTVANSVTQKKSSGQQGFGFVDNRPEFIAPTYLQRSGASMITQLMTREGEMSKAAAHGSLLPSQNQVLGAENLTYHHIVDKDQLMDYWNAMRQIEINHRAAVELEDTVHHIISKAKANAAESTAYEVDGIAAESGALLETALHSASNGREVNTNLGEIIDRMYQWMPGNIFSGPVPDQRWHVGEGPGANDQKDPENDFEFGAQYIIPGSDYDRLYAIYSETSEVIDVVKQTAELRVKVDQTERALASYKGTSERTRGKKLRAIEKAKGELEGVMAKKAWVERWLHLTLIRLWLIADKNQVFPYVPLNWVKKDDAGRAPDDDGYNDEAAKYLIQN